MTKQDLFKSAFDALNSFKRNRALEEISRTDGDNAKGNLHALYQYKDIDRLELALRALQRDSYKPEGDEK